MDTSPTDESGPPTLEAVVPLSASCEFEGGKWWVTAIERWHDRTALQYVVWTGESMINRKPVQGEPRSHWPRSFHVALSDDLGTQYERAGGGGGSGGHVYRGHQEFRTPMPPSAVSLVATLHSTTGGSQHAAALAALTLAL